MGSDGRILWVAAFFGATLLAMGSSPVGAQTRRCFGAEATIVAVAGVSTIGTGGADVIVGTPGPDDIDGRGGDDLICAAGGADVIRGGDGADRIDGGGGDDHVGGGTGQDLIIGGDGEDRLVGGLSSDTIRGGADNDRIWGGGGNDTLDGGPGEDTVFGGPQDDSVLGNTGNDTLGGGRGDDVMGGGAQHDRLRGGSGQDALRGGSGGDQLLGGRGDDRLLGQRGNDNLVGGYGRDSCRSGKGDDTLVACERLFVAPGDSIEYRFHEEQRTKTVGRELDVWLVPAQDTNPSAHALGGEAVVRSARIDLDMTITDAFIVLEPTPFAPEGPPTLGVISALPAGPYAVWVGESSAPVRRLDGVVVNVTAAGVLETPDVSGVTVNPSRALLRQTGLGDVAFGTSFSSALAAFEDRFGPATGDTGWRDGCWFGRSVGWAGISVQFHGTSDQTGKFVSFVTTGDTVLGALSTADGIDVGMSVNEIIALTPTSGFSSFANAIGNPTSRTWSADTAAFGGLAGLLDVDATHPDATLTAIGNGNPNPFFDC